MDHKRARSLVPALLALSMCWVARSAHAQGVQPPAPDLADTIIARIGMVPARHNTFHESRHIAALTHDLSSSGELIYARPGHVQKITHAPRPETLIVQGTTLSLARGQGPARVVDLSHHAQLAALVEAIRAPLDGDITALRHDYTLAAQGDVAHWTLQLTPLPAMARYVRTITIDGQNNAMTVIRVVQANGDTQVMRIDPST
ncbi:hypothetical protein B0W47_10655 [Komagataeibacter nataicola]|uniref:Carbohydrate-binding protein n=2 Tax=Komagataeibacter nataicola TaxID=265960 RepID=A0A9N7CHW4_9PROT|nr:hypothetical protein B0W47_10655 [Komagataeibacter nataicola]PYD66419.1 carbohydrate-binding protein [Komagataeibacter nataicola]